MVINSNNFNKPKNRLSSQTLILTHRTKDHDIWRWKFISWLVTGTTSWCLFYRIVFNTIIFLNCERTDNFSDLKSRPVYSITAYITLSDGHHIKILWKERQLLWPEISSSLLYNSLSDGHHIKILWKERQLLWPEISSSLLYNNLTTYIT
jgi:hypothetical protein